MTRWLPVLLRAAPWLVAALIGWMLWRSHDARILAAARTEAVRDSLSREVVAAREEIARVDSVARDSINVLAHARGAAERTRIVYVDRERVAVQEVAAAGVELAATFDSLASVVPAPLAPLVDSAVAQEGRKATSALNVSEALRGQVGALTGALRTADARDGLRLGQIAARDSLEVQRVVQVSGLEDALAKALHPGLFARLRRAAVPLAVGVVVGGVLIGR